MRVKRWFAGALILAAAILLVGCTRGTTIDPEIIQAEQALSGYLGCYFIGDANGMGTYVAPTISTSQGTFTRQEWVDKYHEIFNNEGAPNEYTYVIVKRLKVKSDVVELNTLIKFADPNAPELNISWNFTVSKISEQWLITSLLTE